MFIYRYNLYLYIIVYNYQKKFYGCIKNYMYKVIYYMFVKSFWFILSGGIWNFQVVNMLIGSGGD